MTDDPMPSPITIDATRPSDVTMLVDADLLQSYATPELAARAVGDAAGTLIANLIDAATLPPAADWLAALIARGGRVHVTIEALP